MTGTTLWRSCRRKLGKERVPERVGIDFGSPLWFALRLPVRSSSFSFCLSLSLSQTGLRFRDCNDIVEFVFVEFVSCTYRLSSKKTRKGKSPGKGGNRFWKSLMVGFKTPREAIEGDLFIFFSRCQGSLLLVFCVLLSDQC
ncbi:hypothetical protein HKD37_20G055642 [Glycine soja]